MPKEDIRLSKKIALYLVHGSGADGGETGNGYINRQEFIDLLKLHTNAPLNNAPDQLSSMHVPPSKQWIIDMKIHKFMRIKMRLKAINSPIRTIKVNTDLLKITMTISSVSSRKCHHFYEKVVDEILAMYKDAEVPIDLFISEQMNCLMEFGQPLPFVRILLQ